jgi:hypothetical protein
MDSFTIGILIGAAVGVGAFWLGQLSEELKKKLTRKRRKVKP